MINPCARHHSYATLHSCNRSEVDKKYLVIRFRIYDHILFVNFWWNTVHLQRTWNYLAVCLSSCVRLVPAKVVSCKHRKASDETKFLNSEYSKWKNHSFCLFEKIVLTNWQGKKVILCSEFTITFSVACWINCMELIKRFTFCRVGTSAWQHFVMEVKHGNISAGEKSLKIFILFVSPLENAFLKWGTIYMTAFGILAERSLAVFMFGPQGARHFVPLK